MKELKSFFLNHYNGFLMKKSVDDAKHYFYSFLGENSSDAAELHRLVELEKQIFNKEELYLIREKKIKLNSNLKRNSHILNETVKVILNQSYKNKVIYQALWLKDIIKYYPSQEEYILKNYGKFVYEIAKSFSKDIHYADLVEKILSFSIEYKNVILFAINSLENVECKLLKSPKINHALQVGVETYLNGGIKNDGVAAAILFDVLQYAPNNDFIREQIKLNTWDYNGKKVLDIFDKTGQNHNLKNSNWKKRKYAQLNVLRTPGTSSFSGSTILAISIKITLREISDYFSKEFDNKTNSFIQEKKEEFWQEYSNISEKEAKDYYSKIFYILCRRGNINEIILNEYENNYLLVFEEYPL